jgi:hypothetical protein
MTISVRIRRVVITAFTATGLIAASIAAASPAAADDPPVILVSSDGVTFAPQLASGLFAGAGLLVPGDSNVTRFWIKNPTPSPASVEVTVAQIVTPSKEFATNVTLGSWNSLAPATITRSWETLKRCGVIVMPRTLAPGGTLEVDLTIAMLNATGNVAQNQTGSLNAVIDMQDAAAGPIVAPVCAKPVTPVTPVNPVEPVGTHNTGGLPGLMAFTGIDPTALLFVAAILLGAGWFLVVVRRRRRKEQ